ncbi:hypothetical protein [Undibacterium sp.]|uniref:hypothetical protein n=1 Tax=Undibacterium sp. TaxID=1914977 RepID=UPI0027319EE0|nr:hypothetical protein [Undibacterium sp.]MDP1980489.1 hypothetical protein [Undibacterium sp.]
MTEQSKPAAAVSEELALLRKIDKKVDGIDQQMAGIRKQAILYGAVAGAAAGGLSGAIVSSGIMAARIKLGM